MSDDGRQYRVTPSLLSAVRDVDSAPQPKRSKNKKTTPLNQVGSIAVWNERLPINEALQPHAARVHTITYDNGKEFAHHAEITSALDTSGYFAYPYHSWERGLNENMNGLVRPYLPKGKSFDLLTQDHIQCIMDRLDNRHRKYLGYKTPNQVFFGINLPIALAS